MTNLKIFLIEDCQDEAKEILDKLNELAKERNDTDYTFQFEFLKGTIEDVEDKKYVFYEADIIHKIEKKLEEETSGGKKIGILLDVLITKEDIENTLSSYYPQASLAKQIYFKFHDNVPIYMITNNATFATQSDVIMGIDLSDQFIAKNALLRYNLEHDIDSLFEFYKQKESSIS